MGMPKIRHVHGHDQVGMPMDMPTLTCPGMSTGMPGLACQGSSIQPDMHTDMQGRHAQGHISPRARMAVCDWSLNGHVPCHPNDLEPRRDKYPRRGPMLPY